MHEYAYVCIVRALTQIDAKVAALEAGMKLIVAKATIRVHMACVVSEAIGHLWVWHVFVHCLDVFFDTRIKSMHYCKLHILHGNTHYTHIH